MTAVALIVGILVGFYLAQRRERHDPDLPGLVDVCTVAAPDVDRPVWVVHPHPFATGRFVAWRDPALRRLSASLTDMRETARRRAGA